jgi:hypothetical protein
MASRTNKQWIAKKKKMLEKLRSLKKWWKRRHKNKNLSEEEKITKWLIFDMENPKWQKFSRDKSWRKIICLQTWLREDFNWYRLIFKPNSQQVEYRFTGINSRLRKKLNKSKKIK